VLVWVVGGTNTSHIGASGVIFGYFGFIMAMGLFERSLKSIAMAVLVGLAYGGLIFGIMPSQPGVSWEGHLFGFLAGVGTAWQLSRQDRLNRAKKPA
jgi:membrane associated rhomboid family serine protease